MADMYSFSGFKLPALPELPEGCTHAVIYYDAEDGVYYLFCSSERIVYNENNVPQLPATTSWGGYAYRSGGTYWFSATFTPEGDVENPDYYLLDQVLLWTNTDICQKDTDTVVLAATTPLQYPTITSISSSRSYTLGEEAETLICEASVNDGELSYQWHHGEETVGEGSSYTPDVSIVGSESYYCIVTNTVSGTQLTTTSRTITITVEEEVEKFSIVAYVSGMVARMCGRRTPYPYSAPVPVAYLYNGIRLPALPEWDREKYPYAAIGKWSDVYQLYFSTVPLTYRNVNPNTWYFDATEDGEALVYQTTTGAMIWEEHEARTFTAGHAVYVMLGKPHWASYDINRSTSGNIVLAASEPIPVYE